MQVGLCGRVADAAHEDPVGNERPVLGAAAVENRVGVRVACNVRSFSMNLTLLQFRFLLNGQTCLTHKLSPDKRRWGGVIATAKVVAGGGRGRHGRRGGGSGGSRVMLLVRRRGRHGPWRLRQGRQQVRLVDISSAKSIHLLGNSERGKDCFNIKI